MTMETAQTIQFSITPAKSRFPFGEGIELLYKWTNAIGHPVRVSGWFISPQVERPDGTPLRDTGVGHCAPPPPPPKIIFAAGEAQERNVKLRCVPYGVWEPMLPGAYTLSATLCNSAGGYHRDDGQGPPIWNGRVASPKIAIHVDPPTPAEFQSHLDAAAHGAIDSIQFLGANRYQPAVAIFVNLLKGQSDDLIVEVLKALILIGSPQALEGLATSCRDFGRQLLVLHVAKRWAPQDVSALIHDCWRAKGIQVWI